MVNSTPQPHFTPEKDPVPIVQEATLTTGAEVKYEWICSAFPLICLYGLIMGYSFFYLYLSVPKDSSFKPYFTKCQDKIRCGHMNVTGLNAGHFGHEVRILSTTQLEALGRRNGSCVMVWSLTFAVLLPACSCEFIGQPSCRHRRA
jgi:hypothetical protein